MFSVVYEMLYKEKGPEFKEPGSGKLHHDNAAAHSAIVVQQFLVKHDTLIVLESPSTPNLAPCDFFLFPKIKMTLMSPRFQDLDEIKPNATEHLRGIFKNDFQKCF